MILRRWDYCLRILIRSSHFESIAPAKKWTGSRKKQPQTNHLPKENNCICVLPGCSPIAAGKIECAIAILKSTAGSSKLSEQTIARHSLNCITKYKIQWQVSCLRSIYGIRQMYWQLAPESAIFRSSHLAHGSSSQS